MKQKTLGYIVAGTMLVDVLVFGGSALAQPAASTAPSYPMQVSTQDQTSLRQICALAQKEPSLSLEQATGIGQYCLGLVNRIGLALSAKQPSESKLGEPNKPAAARAQSPVSPKTEGK